MRRIALPVLALLLLSMTGCYFGPYRGHGRVLVVREHHYYR